MLLPLVVSTKLTISIPQVRNEPPEKVQFTPLDVVANLRKLLGSFRVHSISANQLWAHCTTRHHPAVASRRFTISIPQVGLQPPENIQFTPLDVVGTHEKIQSTPLDVISSNLRKLIGSFRGHSISAKRH